MVYTHQCSYLLPNELPLSSFFPSAQKRTLYNIRYVDLETGRAQGVRSLLMRMLLNRRRWEFSTAFGNKSEYILLRTYEERKYDKKDEVDESLEEE